MDTETTTDEDSSFGIRRVVDVKVEGGRQMYKVEWMCTWEPAETLSQCQHLIDRFWSHVNNAKQQQRQQQQQQQQQQLHKISSLKQEKIENLSEDDKAQVQQLIQRTSSTSSVLRTPSEMLSHPPSNVTAPPPIKNEPTALCKPPKVEPPPPQSQDRKTIGTAGLKYLEGFTNPYVKLIVACRICNKEQSLKFSSNWYKHYVTHSDKKPHQCPHCEKSFVRGDAMRKHVQSKHGGGGGGGGGVDMLSSVPIGNMKPEHNIKTFQW